MSNIHLQPATPAGTGHSFNVSAHPSTPVQNNPSSPGRPSGRQPSAGLHADEAQLEQRLRKIHLQLNPESIERILQSPHSQESRQALDDIRTLLTPANIKRMLQGPNAQANAKVLVELGNLLNVEKLEVSRRSTLARIEKHDWQVTQQRSTEIILKAFDSDGIEDFFELMKNFDDYVSQMEEKSSATNAAARSLGDFGDRLGKKEINAIRFAPLDSQKK